MNAKHYDLNSLDCFAYDGSMVQDGERYQPREDPCETCVCEQGQPISCIVPRCQKPHLPCLNPLQIPGECCKFSCDEPTSLIDGGHADRGMFTEHIHYTLHLCTNLS